MKGFAALATAAMLVVSTILLGINVVGAQGTTVSVSPAYTGPKSVVFEVTVTNNTGQPADNVVIRILKDSTEEDWGLKGVAIIPKGENVRVPTADNTVYIAKDNKFALAENLDNYLLPVDSRLKVVGKPTDIYTYRWDAYTRLTKNENLQVSMQVPTRPNENIESGENLGAAVPLPVSVPSTTSLRAADNIYAYWISFDDNTLAPVDNAPLSVLADLQTTIPPGTDNRAYFTRELPLSFENWENVKALEDKAAPNQVSPYSVSSGDMLRAKENLSSMVGTVVEFAETDGTTVTLPSGCTVIREKGRTLVAENRDRVVTLPIGWNVTPIGLTLSFTGVSDNLPSGATRTFKFAADLTGVASGKYTIRVDLYRGSVWITNSTGYATVEVDATPPEVTSVTATPSWAKGGQNVSLEVKFSEVVTVENITIKENNGTEVQLNFTSTDNITWTATYTVSDNENRDGAVTIHFVTVKDRAGNLLREQSWDNVLFADRTPPAKINLRLLDNWPGNLPNKRITETTVYVKASKMVVKDNYPKDVENENTVAKVVLKVGTTEYQLSPDPEGNWCGSITLPAEGIYYMALYAVDKAGNVGEENGENVVYDVTPPTISIASPENNLITNDNTQVLRVTVTDMGLGLDNSKFIEDENVGLVIKLFKGSLGGELIAEFSPKENENFFKATIDNNRPSDLVSIITGFAFENEYPELEDNDYYLLVCAGDNQQADNKWIKFTIDTKAPPAPPQANITGTLGLAPIGTVYQPRPTRDKTVQFGGLALADSAKVKIFITTDGGLNWKEIKEVDVTEGTWSATIDVSPYEGQTVGIGVRAYDKAGNKSELTLYGYLIYDAKAPTVEIVEKELKTDKASVVIHGKVKIDPWEKYDDITVTVQPLTAAIAYNRATGEFTVSAKVEEGTNIVTVTATDKVGNSSTAYATITRTVTPWATYATILVVIALVLAAVAIFRKR